MAKPTGKRVPNKKRNAYQHQPSSVCVTIYSHDGAPVSDDILQDAADSIAHIAKNHNLLINTARA